LEITKYLLTQSLCHPLLSMLQAGFAAPAAELEYKVSTATAGAESLKDMLARIKPYTTPGATNKHGHVHFRIKVGEQNVTLQALCDVCHTFKRCPDQCLLTVIASVTAMAMHTAVMVRHAHNALTGVLAGACCAVL
jgi:hypothetical protein